MSDQGSGATDRLLQERFQSLRAEDRRSAPDVEAMLGQVRAELDGLPIALPGPADPWSDRNEASDIVAAPRVPVRLPLVIGTLAAAAFAGLMFVGQGERDEFDIILQQYAQSRSTGLWESPTAGLMDVPGMEFVRTMPSLGHGFGAGLTAPGHVGVENDT